MKRIFVAITLAFLLMGCSYELMPTKVKIYPPLFNYKYAYVMTTGTTTGGSMNGMVSQTSAFVGGLINSTTPSDLIRGELMNQGYIVLPQLEENLKEQTLIVSYGELSERQIDLLYKAKHILIQFRDASTLDIIASAETEASYGNDAKNINHAVQKALHSIFANARAGFYTQTEQ